MAGVHHRYPWQRCGSTTHSHVEIELSEHVIASGEECECRLPHRSVPANELPVYDQSHCDDCDS